MAKREITRNVFRQIISNGLDPNGVFTDYESHLLEMGLTVFNQDIYDRILDGASDTFIFDERQLPDSTPRIISERGFVDKTLFINVILEPTVNMTLYGLNGGTSAFGLEERNASLRAFYRDQVLKRDHAFNPDNFIVSEQFDIIYIPPLKQGTQLKLKPAGLIQDFDALDDYVPQSGGGKTYHVIKRFDEFNDTGLRDALSGAQYDLFEDILEDKERGGFDAQTATERSQIDQHINNTQFAGGVLEVDDRGKILEVHKITGNYKPGTGPDPQMLSPSRGSGDDGKAYILTAITSNLG
jgi:hypothetical protein